MSKNQIEEMAKLNAIEEMEAVIRSKTVSCESCDFYKNGICDDACELAEDNHKICTDLYNEGYRKHKEGEWEAKEHISTSKTRGRTIHYATYKCSVCGKWNGRKKQKYCPNCGAKMKGGAE